MSKAKNILKIITDKDKLSSRCDEINVVENKAYVTRIINELKDTIRANKDLVSLSAPQLGYNARIFCIRFSNGDIRAFINPMITKVQGMAIDIETDPCDKKEYMVVRSERIMVAYQTPLGTAETDISLKYPISGVFEQMRDLIDGTLFFTEEYLGLSIDDNYYKADKAEKDELHSWFINTFYPERRKFLNDFADKDEDIKKTQEAVSFITSVINGETEVVPVNDKNELDFEHSSLKAKEEQDKMQEAYLKRIKDKYGIK